jgi:phosphatidylglycerophosphatase C
VKNIAFFDFDGTLTYVDSTTLFYKSLYRWRICYFYFNYIVCFLELFLVLINKSSYLKLKNKRLRVNLNRISLHQFVYFKDRYLDSIFPLIIKNSGLEKISQLKEMNFEIVIVSASYDFLLSDWCETLGLGLITNRVMIKEFKICPEKLDCNFQNKVDRILDLYNLDEYKNILAFGDSNGDLAMLELAYEKYFNYFE